MKLIGYVDGGGNQAVGASIGVNLLNEQEESIWEFFLFIGNETSNVAEYSSVLACIYKALDLGCTDLVVYSDSRLIVKQILGDFRITKEHLKDYWQEVQYQIIKFASFEINWIPREDNKRADKLTRKARGK